jgi:hypothetical protein
MDDQSSIRSEDVIKTIAYFDVFRYPLTGEQIYRFLPRNGIGKEQLADIVRRLVAAGVLNEFNGYYFLPTEARDIVVQRKEDEKRAEHMMRYARRVSWVLKQFPFTRAVFITGSLSKDIAAADSDIDFMIVTSAGRLWICKILLTLFRKIFLLGSNKYFCTNFYVAEHDYTLSERNMYAAIELLTAKVMWNIPAFIEFQQANSWANFFLPNCSPSVDPTVVLPQSRSWLQRFMESVLDLFPLSSINLSLMNRFKRHWEKIYSDLSDEQRAASFHTSPNAATVWKTDYSRIVLDRYRNKLAELGVEELYD